MIYKIIIIILLNEFGYIMIIIDLMPLINFIFIYKIFILINEFGYLVIINIYNRFKSLN